MVGRLLAWDPKKQRRAGASSIRSSSNSGVLSTAGNLVFHGQGTGEFAAYAADTARSCGRRKPDRRSMRCRELKFHGEQYVVVPVAGAAHSGMVAPRP